jgi:competence protein ComEA
MVPGGETALSGFDRFGHFANEKKYLHFICAGIGALCIALAFAAVISLRGSSDSSDAETPDEFVSAGFSDYETNEAYEAGGTQEPAPWAVYVTGAVMSPGVYEIPEGSRIGHAIKMAGGFTPQADDEALNLAEIAGDGVHIRVPLKGAEDGPGRLAMPQASPLVRRPASGGTSGGRKHEAVININEATAEELQELPGIGQVLSSAIIAYRETSGLFAETEDLMKVNGIGRKRFEAIRDLVTVSR